MSVPVWPSNRRGRNGDPRPGRGFDERVPRSGGDPFGGERFRLLQDGSGGFLLLVRRVTVPRQRAPDQTAKVGAHILAFLEGFAEFADMPQLLRRGQDDRIQIGIGSGGPGDSRSIDPGSRARKVLLEKREDDPAFRRRDGDRGSLGRTQSKVFPVMVR